MITLARYNVKLRRLKCFVRSQSKTVLLYLAVSERENIKKRQAEGIAAAKLRGVRFGRPEKDLPSNFGELVRKWEQRQIRTADIVKQCQMSRAAFYIKLKEYKLLNKQNCPEKYKLIFIKVSFATLGVAKV